jgi:hypothetical protein
LAYGLVEGCTARRLIKLRTMADQAWRKRVLHKFTMAWTLYQPAQPS